MNRFDNWLNEEKENEGLELGIKTVGVMIKHIGSKVKLLSLAL